MCKLSLLDHDYCYTAWCAAQPSEDLGDMEKLLSTVAMGGENSQLVSPPLAMMPMKVMVPPSNLYGLQLLAS